MSHLFLFSNIVAAMIGAAALVLLLLAFIHSKEKQSLHAFLLFLAATADYLLFITATYCYKILLVDTSYGFRAIQSARILLTGSIYLPALSIHISSIFTESAGFKDDSD